MMAVNSATSEPLARQRAFVELVGRVQGELRGFVRHMVGSDHLAQDILQRTFLLAWRDAKFDPRHAYARAWLFTAARRIVIDCHRSEKSNAISLDDLSERARRDGSRGSRSAIPADRRSRDPLIDLIDTERNRKLEVALAMLTTDQRDVLERYYLQQEGTQFEIAQTMGLTIAAFNSRLNRARKELKRMILSLPEHDDWMRTSHDS